MSHGGSLRLPTPLAAVRLRPRLGQEAGEPVAIGPAEPPAFSAVAPIAVDVHCSSGRWTCPAHALFAEEECGREGDQVPGSPRAARQGRIYQSLVSELVVDAVDGGRGGAIVAVGPGGGGKSHSVLGYGHEPGLIPHATLELFRLAAAGTNGRRVQIWCSFLEIHNEQLVDLLAPAPAPEAECAKAGSQQRGLEVVELPGGGVHVLGLTECAVQSIAEVQQLVDFGNKRRAAASRLIGVRGRSHTVFYLHILSWKAGETGEAGNLESRPERARLTFVDCASAALRGADASLEGLAHVLHDLAAGGTRARGLNRAFYRQSRLTQLLEASLSGYERLVLIAAVAPGGKDADQASACLELVRATVDAAAVMQRRAGREGAQLPTSRRTQEHLQQEVEELQRQLFDHGRPFQGPGMEARAATLQRVLLERSATTAPWKEQLEQAQRLREAQEASMSALGLASDQDLSSGYACLLRLSSDPMLTGCIAHTLWPGAPVTLGTQPGPGGVLLEGLGVASQHAQIVDGGDGRLWVINLYPSRSRLLLNGKSLDSPNPEQLQNGDRLQIGWAHELLFLARGCADYAGEMEAADVTSRPLEQLIEESTLLAKELDGVRDASGCWKYVRFEAAESGIAGRATGDLEEPFVRAVLQPSGDGGSRWQAQNEQTLLWSARAFREQWSSMRDLYCMHTYPATRPCDSTGSTGNSQPVNMGNCIYTNRSMSSSTSSSRASGSAVAISRRGLREEVVLDGFSVRAADNKTKDGRGRQHKESDTGLPCQTSAATFSKLVAAVAESGTSRDADESLLSPRQEMPRTLQRALNISESIGNAVSMLKDTMEEIKSDGGMLRPQGRVARQASGISSEVLQQLQAENEELRQRLDRLEEQAKQKEPNIYPGETEFCHGSPGWKWPFSLQQVAAQGNEAMATTPAIPWNPAMPWTARMISLGVPCGIGSAALPSAAPTSRSASPVMSYAAPLRSPSPGPMQETRSRTSGILRSMTPGTPCHSPGPSYQVPQGGVAAGLPVKQDAFSFPVADMRLYSAPAYQPLPTVSPQMRGRSTSPWHVGRPQALVVKEPAVGSSSRKSSAAAPVTRTASAQNFGILEWRQVSLPVNQQEAQVQRLVPREVRQPSPQRRVIQLNATQLEPHEPLTQLRSASYASAASGPRRLPGAAPPRVLADVRTWL
eukprot:TRINITY_DN24974_c0_g1_i1.p1 TRINITY_DN24974_c0_g1~~TRINITY_DN24974_c0_g1_i1.p1  ORF type:complete len:1175 (-),score=247.14 TRINITY_DN24974_c0_g1_i1:168-3692(-)